MKHNVIHITSLKEAVPVSGIWYQYFEDIFISVVPKENIVPHLRIKNQNDITKSDNKMCAWHSDWQYLKIEQRYGRATGNVKTYEVIIEVDSIRHIIDSVVDKIAIEFQHTLTVSIEEMDSRYIAHKKHGYIPYLILDLSDYEYSKFYRVYHSVGNIDFNEEVIKSISKILKKWKNTLYYKNDSLFVDLHDRIVRLSDKLYDSLIYYTHEDFLNKIKELDSHFSQEVKIERERREKRNAERRQYEYEQQIEEEKEEIERNRKTKLEAKSFEYFRRCFRNAIIRPYVLKCAKDFISCEITTESIGNKYYKSHLYVSETRNFKILYKTTSEISFESSGYMPQKIYKYLYAKVSIIDGIGVTSKQINFKITKEETKRLD